MILEFTIDLQISKSNKHGYVKKYNLELNMLDKTSKINENYVVI